MRIQATRETHEYQRRVQILVISLIELSVVLPSHTTVISIESGTQILQSPTRILSLTVEWFQ